MAHMKNVHRSDLRELPDWYATLDKSEGEVNIPPPAGLLPEYDHQRPFAEEMSEEETVVFHVAQEGGSVAAVREDLGESEPDQCLTGVLHPPESQCPVEQVLDLSGPGSHLDFLERESEPERAEPLLRRSLRTRAGQHSNVFNLPRPVRSLENQRPPNSASVSSLYVPFRPWD